MSALVKRLQDFTDDLEQKIGRLERENTEMAVRAAVRHNYERQRMSVKHIIDQQHYRCPNCDTEFHEIK